MKKRKINAFELNERIKDVARDINALQEAGVINESTRKEYYNVSFECIKEFSAWLVKYAPDNVMIRDFCFEADCYDEEDDVK